jgi:DNA-binding response OmpR family regulator
MAETPAIIVCDDEPDLREAVAEYLARRGFDVRRAEDGAVLRRLLAERTADLVVLDIAMPGEDGLSVARALRAESDIGIVMLSAAAAPREAGRAARAGRRAWRHSRRRRPPAPPRGPPHRRRRRA